MVLKSLGCGFDCASLSEINDAISSGASSDDVLFAQPYKQISHLQESLKLGITSVCDEAGEILKVGKTARMLGVRPRVLIRILPDQGGKIDKFNMSSKFGAPFETILELADSAKKAGVDITGVCFHVGSCCDNSDVYTATLAMARRWWDALVEEGFSLTTLDIGGGFPGEGGDIFKQFSSVVNTSLQESFGDIRGMIQVIAEPGRFMVTSSQTLLTPVIARKGEASFVVTTGNWSALTPWFGLSHKPYKVVLNEGAVDILMPPIEKSIGGLTLWGPTCDGRDVLLLPGYDIPDLKVGDWIAFPDQGAYAHSAMSRFNGFELPEIKYAFSTAPGEHITSQCGFTVNSVIYTCTNGRFSNLIKSMIGLE